LALGKAQPASEKPAEAVAEGVQKDRSAKGKSQASAEPKGPDLRGDDERQEYNRQGANRVELSLKRRQPWHQLSGNAANQKWQEHDQQQFWQDGAGLDGHGQAPQQLQPQGYGDH